MKQLLIYYFQILLPIPLLVSLANISSISFVVGLILYVLIYRPLVDGYRLLSKGIISKNEFFKIFIPLWRLKYFTELYFE